MCIRDRVNCALQFNFFNLSSRSVSYTHLSGLVKKKKKKFRPSKQIVVAQTQLQVHSEQSSQIQIQIQVLSDRVIHIDRLLKGLDDKCTNSIQNVEEQVNSLKAELNTTVNRMDHEISTTNQNMNIIEE